MSGHYQTSPLCNRPGEERNTWRKFRVFLDCTFKPDGPGPHGTASRSNSNRGWPQTPFSPSVCRPRIRAMNSSTTTTSSGKSTFPCGKKQGNECLRMLQPLWLGTYNKEYHNVKSAGQAIRRRDPESSPLTHPA